MPQLETFTILTAPPNADVEPYHDRMPLIIDIGKAAEWITGPSANLYPSDLPLEVNEARLS